MEVKIFKWSNVINHICGDEIMEKAFDKFKDRVELSDWKSPNDIVKSFRTADTITCKGSPFNRVVFDIGGNKYRMICGYKFGKKNVVLYVRFVGTHAVYDEVNPCNINMF